MAKEAKAAAPIEEEIPVSEPTEMFDIVVIDEKTKEQFTARTMSTSTMMAGVDAVLTANGYTMNVSAQRKIDVTEALRAQTKAKAAKKR